MYRVEYLPSFEDDLNNILAYYELECQSPRTADRIVEELDKTVSTLALFPRMFPRYDPVFSLGTMYRMFFIKGNAVFYTIEDEAKIIKVHRMLNGRMDFDQWL